MNRQDACHHARYLTRIYQKSYVVCRARDPYEYIVRQDTKPDDLHSVTDRFVPNEKGEAIHELAH